MGQDSLSISDWLPKVSLHYSEKEFVFAKNSFFLFYFYMPVKQCVIDCGYIFCNNFFIFLNKNEQQERKEVDSKSSDGKSKDDGVSQAAVQAFLVKKEIEKKKKAGRRNWSVLVSVLLISSA